MSGHANNILQTRTSGHSLGDLEHWVAPKGISLSLVVPTMKHSKTYLKKKLRELDRRLSSFSYLKRYKSLNPDYLKELYKLDLQRKEIRRELKYVTNLHRG